MSPPGPAAPSGADAHSRIAAWLPTVVGVLVLVLLTGWGVWPAPTQRIVGAADAPTLDHLWGLWVTAEGLFSHGPFLRDTPAVGFPDGFRGLQYEAPNLLLFLPGHWLAGGGVPGAALGWNTLALGAPALAAVGTAVFVRDLAGRHPSLVVAALAYGASPWLLGSPAMAHTEYLAAAWWPWHLWMLQRFLRGGRWPWGLGATVTLGAMASTASYLPVFLALLEPLVAGWLAWRNRAWLRLVPVAVGSAALVGLFYWALLQPWPRGYGAVAGQMGLSKRPLLAALATVKGLTRLGPGGLRLDENEQPAYVGLVVLTLGLVGSVADRRARIWLAAGLGAAVLGAGVGVRWGPQALLLPAGWLLQLSDVFALVHWWQRIGVVAALPLAVAAFFGARWLGDRVGRPSLVAAALSAGLVVDHATFPRSGVLPPESLALAPAPALTALLEGVEDGAILPLPLALVHLPGPPVTTGRFLMGQPFHGRPVTTIQSLRADHTLTDSYLTRLVANRQAALSRGNSTGFAGGGPLSDEERACARGAAELLHKLGVAAVVLETDVGVGAELEGLLTEVLGTPRAQGAARVYPLAEVDPGVRCGPPVPAPPVAPILDF